MIDPISLTIYVVVGAAHGVTTVASVIAAGVAAHSTAAVSGVALLSLGALYKTMADNNDLKAQMETLRNDYAVLLVFANDESKKLAEVLKKAKELEAKVIAFEASVRAKEQEIAQLNLCIENIEVRSVKNKNEISVLTQTVNVLVEDNRKAQEIAHNSRQLITVLQAKLVSQQAYGPKLFDANSAINPEKSEPQVVGMFTHVMNKLRQRK